ncbi:MAG: peptide chain release factor N(5)-glutamine methyltransferase [Solirubrobacteraceae bacterium]
MSAAVSARDALDGARTAIGASGSATPQLDAELLLCAALGVTRERLLMEPELPVAGEAVRRYQAFVRRRSVQGEPVAYIRGRQAFRHIELHVDRRVLIPRPETELLVEVAIARLPRGARVLDLATGSGAVACALALERPDLAVEASDVDRGALELAQENAARLGAPVVAWHQADGVPRGTWDAVLCNPPYIPTAELAGLEVARHEPRLALDGGADGLDLVRRLTAEIGSPLLVLEVGAAQARQAAALMSAHGRNVAVHPDLAGIPRVLAGELQ